MCSCFPRTNTQWDPGVGLQKQRSCNPIKRCQAPSCFSPAESKFRSGQTTCWCKSQIVRTRFFFFWPVLLSPHRHICCICGAQNDKPVLQGAPQAAQRRTLSVFRSWSPGSNLWVRRACSSVQTRLPFFFICSSFTAAVVADWGPQRSPNN